MMTYMYVMAVAKTELAYNKMMKQKRAMGALGWITIVILLIAVGIGAYFLLTGDSSPVAIVGSSPIPQPPALPSG